MVYLGTADSVSHVIQTLYNQTVIFLNKLSMQNPTFTCCLFLVIFHWRTLSPTAFPSLLSPAIHWLYPHCLLILAHSLHLYTPLSLYLPLTLSLSLHHHTLHSPTPQHFPSHPWNITLSSVSVLFPSPIQISIINADGAYFKKYEYSISVDADLPKNTPVFSLKNELILDRTVVQEMLSLKFKREPKTFRIVNLCMLECVWNYCTNFRHLPCQLWNVSYYIDLHTCIALAWYWP